MVEWGADWVSGVVEQLSWVVEWMSGWLNRWVEDVWDG